MYSRMRGGQQENECALCPRGRAKSQQVLVADDGQLGIRVNVIRIPAIMRFRYSGPLCLDNFVRTRYCPQSARLRPSRPTLKYCHLGKQHKDTIIMSDPNSVL